MITYIGQLNLGGITPISLSASAALVAAINIDLAAMALLTAGLNVTPPSFGASISAIAALLAQLNLGISVSLPSIDFQATAVAAAIATISAELAIPLSFQLLLGGGAGIYAYAYEGITSGFGASVTSALAPGWPDGTGSGVNANAIILGVVTPSVWTDVLSFFGVVPPSLPSGLTYIAQCNIGTLCPVCVTATAGIIADLKARLAGLIALAAQLSIHPPSFAASLTLATDLLVALNAALSLNLPGVSFQLQAIAALVASLTAKLNALLALSLTLGGAAGVFVYTYSGTGAAMGGEITAALSGGWPDSTSVTSNANALVLGVVSPAVWAIVSTFFGGV